MSNTRKRELTPVTVCIAAICENGARIIGASDRMITAGGIVEFEPPQSKVWPLTSSVVAMCAGDISVLAEIMERVHIEVQARAIAEPQNWWRVRDVAELYRRNYREATIKRAQNSILEPLGLTTSSFISSQQQMDTRLVNKLADNMTNFQLPSLEVIFVGIDNDGPQGLPPESSNLQYSHIYVVRGSQISCEDTVAFAAIGIGTSHAESQFMFARHTRTREFAETLLLTFSAKTYAEVAPGVGKLTDMFSIGPGVGVSAYIEPRIVTGLERIYQNTRKQINRTNKRAEQKAKKYIEEITAAATVKPQTAKVEESVTATDSASVTVEH